MDIKRKVTHGLQAGVEGAVKAAKYHQEKKAAHKAAKIAAKEEKARLKHEAWLAEEPKRKAEWLTRKEAAAKERVTITEFNMRPLKNDLFDGRAYEVIRRDENGHPIYPVRLLVERDEYGDPVLYTDETFTVKAKEWNGETGVVRPIDKEGHTITDGHFVYEVDVWHGPIIDVVYRETIQVGGTQQQPNPGGEPFFPHIVN